MSDPTPQSRTCRVCGCTEERACTGADGQPCHWVLDDLCSVCAETMELAPYAVVALDRGTRPDQLAATLNSFAALGYHVIGLTSTHAVLEHIEFAATLQFDKALAMAAQRAEAPTIAAPPLGLVVPGR